jgi:4a-hydroxytetrahydrobiopterin dehydratase|tara:strand:+ start:514 stop:777 length:264 start_codon:yes stop_codon:yes gene_type:complete
MKKNLDQWEYLDTRIRRVIIFVDFIEAMKAMNLIALIAEKYNHHPDWSNTYNKLDISLQTHTKKNVTELDYTVAEEINKLVKENFGI